MELNIIPEQIRKTRAGSNNHKNSNAGGGISGVNQVRHIGILSNQFIEDLDLIYKL